MMDLNSMLSNKHKPKKKKKIINNSFFAKKYEIKKKQIVNRKNKN